MLLLDNFLPHSAWLINLQYEDVACSLDISWQKVVTLAHQFLVVILLCILLHVLDKLGKGKSGLHK